MSFQIVSECLASVLLNSSNLMRIDLEGANLLAPYLVTALETVLPEREIKIASRRVLLSERVLWTRDIVLVQ